MCTSFSINPFEGRGARRLTDTTLKEEHRDERVDRERLGETEADDHGHLQLGQDFRLAAHRLHGPPCRGSRSRFPIRWPRGRCGVEVRVLALPGKAWLHLLGFSIAISASHALR